MSTFRRLRIYSLAASASLVLLAARPAAAQEPILLDGVDEMSFDRPESWALKYFTSLSMMTGLGVPGEIEKGSIELGLEGGWVPSLSEEERRVGFIGDKVEDINRTSIFGRVRATFGLPGSLALTIGVTPPIEVNGVTPELFNLALARPILDRPGFRLGLRLHAQTGTIEGDLTCPRDVAASTDPVVNPEQCHEPSSDEVTQDYAGLEVSIAPRIWGERWEPHVSVSANYLDLEFQVRARYSVFDDRERLLTDGWTYSVAMGVGYRFSPAVRLSGEVFYTPLDVVRDRSRGAQADELINARLLVSYAVR